VEIGPRTASSLFGLLESDPQRHPSPSPRAAIANVRVTKASFPVDLSRKENDKRDQIATRHRHPWDNLMSRLSNSAQATQELKSALA
jgi:hypothetical protein